MMEGEAPDLKEAIAEFNRAQTALQTAYARHGSGADEAAEVIERARARVEAAKARLQQATSRDGRRG